MQVVMLVVAGEPKAGQIDEGGLASLAVLRLMGLPALQVLVQGRPDASLKDRSAAKKRAQAAVTAQVACCRMLRLTSVETLGATSQFKKRAQAAVNA